MFPRMNCLPERMKSAWWFSVVQFITCCFRVIKFLIGRWLTDSTQMYFTGMEKRFRSEMRIRYVLRALWGLSEGSVRTQWMLCEGSVKAQWGFWEGSVRSLWGVFCSYCKVLWYVTYLTKLYYHFLHLIYLILQKKSFNQGSRYLQWIKQSKDSDIQTLFMLRQRCLDVSGADRCIVYCTLCIAMFLYVTRTCSHVCDTLRWVHMVFVYHNHTV